MGKNSWLTAVKRAFRSPTKDSDKKSSRRKIDHQQQDEDEKKTERRGWLFKRHSNNNHNPHSSEQQMEGVDPTEHRHAIAVATAAAEAAVATAKAAIEIIRLTQPSVGPNLQSAARVIQTAFRGYLARRALVALKGIVKLQALIRGQNVRKQATLTMRCMQTLLRVQTRMRARLSHQGGRRSMFAETSNLWESNYNGDIRERKSRSRDGSCVSDDCPRTLEELEAILKARNEASLAFAFSRQNKIVDSDESSEVDNRANWLDQWMPSRQQPWENNSRPSTDYRRADSAIKTIDIDSLRTSSVGGRKSRCQSPVPQSPRHRSQSPCHMSRPTKSPQIRPSSPRCLKEENYQSAANTPSVRSTPRVNSSVSVPNYMAATESAKARIRWQSAPRQRPATPEREKSGYGSARKRLSYPIPEPYSVNFGFGNLRSPSFKSVRAGYVGMEEQSCYAESVGGEISPCSTTDLRMWMR